MNNTFTSEASELTISLSEMGSNNHLPPINGSRINPKVKKHVYPKDCFDPKSLFDTWWVVSDNLSADNQKEWRKRANEKRRKPHKPTIKERLVSLFEENNTRTAPELKAITKHYHKSICELRQLGHVIDRSGMKENAIYIYEGVR